MFVSKSWSCLAWPHIASPVLLALALVPEGLSLALPGGLCIRGSFSFQLKLLPSHDIALSCQAKQHFYFQGLPSIREPRRTFQAPFLPLFLLFLVDHVRAHSMNSAHGKGRVKTDCCPLYLPFWPQEFLFVPCVCPDPVDLVRPEHGDFL